MTKEQQFKLWKENRIASINKKFKEDLKDLEHYKNSTSDWSIEDEKHFHQQKVNRIKNTTFEEWKTEYENN